MKRLFRKTLLGVLAIGLTVQPANACWNNAEQDAVKISHLNMMLMVTALRCRNGPDNFLDQYNQFVRSNNTLLGSQNSLIRNRLAVQVGSSGAFNALDKMTIEFANSYGGGHPNMGCRDIRILLNDIVLQQQNVNSLSTIADNVVGVTYLSGGKCPVAIASRK